MIELRERRGWGKAGGVPDKGNGGAERMEGCADEHVDDFLEERRGIHRTAGYIWQGHGETMDHVGSPGVRIRAAPVPNAHRPKGANDAWRKGEAPCPAIPDHLRTRGGGRVEQQSE